jgi:hypothetical protein
MDHVAQADFELAQDAHVEGLGEHFAHQHHLPVQPAVFDDEFADVLEDQLEHALEGFAHGVLVFGGPVEPGAQRLEALEKFGRGEAAGAAHRFGQRVGVVGDAGLEASGVGGDAVQQHDQQFGEERARGGGLGGRCLGRGRHRGGLAPLPRRAGRRRCYGTSCATCR